MVVSKPHQHPQGAIDFDAALLEQPQPASSAGPAALQPLPIPLLEESFPVSLERLFRTVMQPDPAFIEHHFRASGYSETEVGPWTRNAGA